MFAKITTKNYFCLSCWTEDEETDHPSCLTVCLYTIDFCLFVCFFFWSVLANKKQKNFSCAYDMFAIFLKQLREWLQIIILKQPRRTTWLSSSSMEKLILLFVLAWITWWFVKTEITELLIFCWVGVNCRKNSAAWFC